MIDSLPDPSFSQLFALAGIQKISQASDFWKWSALILALLASFGFTTVIISRFQILAVEQKRWRSKPTPTPVNDSNFDTDSSDTFDYSSSSDDEQERDIRSTSREWRRVDENFQVRGSAHVIGGRGQKSHFRLRRRRASFVDLFSLSELVAGGKSVVKLWDNLGIGFGLEFDDDGDDSDEFNFFDTNEEQKMAPFQNDKCGVQAVSKPSSPAVLVSAGADFTGHVAVSAWDTRIPNRKPSILAEWFPRIPAGKITAVNRSAGEISLADIRKANAAAPALYRETWWDADAVFVLDESS